jgi:glycosyltransferase involved in cell wall biosynthesis
MRDDITLVTKTFERPGAILNLLTTFRKFYPDIRVIVVDDSRTTGEYRLDVGAFPGVDYIRTPFDIGVSAGRNLAIKHVKTPYLFLCDDDHMFTQHTDLNLLKDALEMSGVDILACRAEDGSDCACFAHNEDGVHLVAANHGSSRTIHGVVVRYDVVPQRFLAKTKIFEFCQWDEELKIGGEHWAFFYDHKELLNVGFLENVIIRHIHTDYNNDFYNQHRHRDPAYQMVWNQKRGIKNFYNLGGRCMGLAWQ